MEVVTLLGMLGICSWDDLWKRQIHLAVLAVFSILGVLFHLYYGSRTTWDLLGGVGIGLLLYFVSLLTGEKIGKGDAFLVMATGIYLGIRDNLLLLWIGSLLAGMTGLFLYVIRKKRPKDQLPFVPFLFVAYLVLLGVQIWMG